MANYLSGLNAGQKMAVLHNEGPLLVLAGAGSGKTRVLTSRIARLVRDKKCRPSEILAVTFTNKAAREMRERMAGLVSKQAAQAMTLSTFHSLGARILKEAGRHIGLQRNFSILSDYERTASIKETMRSIGRGMKNETHESFAAEISLAKSADIDPGAYTADEEHKVKTAKVYRRYRDLLMKRQCVDFDDLLLLPLRLFERYSEVRTCYQKKFTFVSIDEFQDTNAVQMKLAKILAAPQNNIMVVGDDDQGIYSWRGAEIDNILNFATTFKKCKTVILDINYRSTEQILEGAHAVVARNIKRKAKHLTSACGSGKPIQTYKADDELDEAEWIAQTIKEHLEHNRYRFGDHALLMRTNAMMRRFEEELRRARIPYRTVGATSFFDRKEVRDILAYLRFFANPEDELSLTRVLKVPEKGISKSVIESLDDLAGVRKISLFKAMLHARDAVGLSDTQIAHIDDFVAYFRKYREQIASCGLSKSIRAALQECGYFAMAQRAFRNEDGSNPRLENIEELLTGLEQFERKAKSNRSGLDDYLRELSLLANEASEDDLKTGPNRVTLMTLHKAKGLEFPVVFLAGLDNAVIPSPRSIEEGKIDEERRLFYVGMTRARKELILTYPATKLFRSKMTKVRPCQFLHEIPQAYLDGAPGAKAEENYQEFVSDFFHHMQEKLGSNAGQSA
ncbi:MAG: AAA family ATPase [Chitinivibrionales bacterium]|nr:AAA family ATPase [Chitinivibrionales bacterium]